MQTSWTFKVRLSDVQMRSTHRLSQSAVKDSTHTTQTATITTTTAAAAAPFALRLAFDGKVTDLPLSSDKELHSFTYEIEAESEAALAVSLAQRYVTCQLLRPVHTNRAEGEQRNAEAVYGEWRSTLLALIVAADPHYAFACHEDGIEGGSEASPSVRSERDADVQVQQQGKSEEDECVAFVLTMEEEQTMVIQPQAMHVQHLPRHAVFGLVYSAEMVSEAELRAHSADAKARKGDDENEVQCGREAVAAATTRMRAAVRRGSSAMTPTRTTVMDHNTNSHVCSEEDVCDAVLHFAEAQLPRLQVRITQSSLPRVRLSVWLLQHVNKGGGAGNSTSLTSGLAAMAQMKLWAAFVFFVRPVPASMEACDTVTQRFDLTSSLVRMTGATAAHEAAATMLDCTLSLTGLPCFRSLAQLAIADADLTSVLTAASSLSSSSASESAVNASSGTAMTTTDEQSKLMDAMGDDKDEAAAAAVAPHTPRGTPQLAPAVVRPLPLVFVPHTPLQAKTVKEEEEEEEGGDEDVPVVVQAEPILLLPPPTPLQQQSMSDDEGNAHGVHTPRIHTPHTHKDKKEEEQQRYAHHRALWDNALLTPSHSPSDVAEEAAAAAVVQVQQQQEAEEQPQPRSDVQQSSNETHRTLYLPPRSPPRQTYNAVQTNTPHVVASAAAAAAAAVAEDEDEHPLPMHTIDAPLSYMNTPVQQPQQRDSLLSQPSAVLSAASSASHLSLSPALAHYVPTAGVYHELLLHRERGEYTGQSTSTTPGQAKGALHASQPAAVTHVSQISPQQQEQQQQEQQHEHEEGGTSAHKDNNVDAAMLSVMEQKAVMDELQRIKESCRDTLHSPLSFPCDELRQPSQELPVMHDTASVRPASRAERKLSLTSHSVHSASSHPSPPSVHTPRQAVHEAAVQGRTPHTPRQPRPTHQASSQCGPDMTDKATGMSLSEVPPTQATTKTKTEKEEKEEAKVHKEEPDDDVPQVRTPEVGREKSPSVILPQPPQSSPKTHRQHRGRSSQACRARASLHAAQQSSTTTAHTSSNAGLSCSPSQDMPPQTISSSSPSPSSPLAACKRPSSEQVAAACTSIPGGKRTPHSHTAQHTVTTTTTTTNSTPSAHIARPPPTLSAARHHTTLHSSTSSGRTTTITNKSASGRSVHKTRTYERPSLTPRAPCGEHPYNQPRPATSHAAPLLPSSARTYFSRSRSSSSHAPPPVTPALAHPFYHYPHSSYNNDTVRYEHMLHKSPLLHLPRFALRRCSSACEPSLSSPRAKPVPASSAGTRHVSSRRSSADPLHRLFCRQGHTGWVYVEDSTDNNDENNLLREENEVNSAMSERRSSGSNNTTTTTTTFFDSTMHLDCSGVDGPLKRGRRQEEGKHALVEDKPAVVRAWE